MPLICKDQAKRGGKYAEHEQAAGNAARERQARDWQLPASTWDQGKDAQPGQVRRGSRTGLRGAIAGQQARLEPRLLSAPFLPWTNPAAGGLCCLRGASSSGAPRKRGTRGSPWHGARGQGPSPCLQRVEPGIPSPSPGAQQCQIPRHDSKRTPQ